MAAVNNSVEIIGNESLPTLFVDHVSVSGRNDDIMYIRFSTSTPEGIREQARIITTKKALERMQEVFSKALALAAAPLSKKPGKGAALEK